jgi:hypothetical protein
MLELYYWDVGMSALALALVALGALVIGMVSMVIGEVTHGWHWAVVAIGAFVGGWLGSEAFGTLSTWGYEFEGLYVVPAIIGGLVLGFVADAVLRIATKSSYVRHPQPI